MIFECDGKHDDDDHFTPGDMKVMGEQEEEGNRWHLAMSSSHLSP